MYAGSLMGNQLTCGSGLVLVGAHPLLQQLDAQLCCTSALVDGGQQGQYWPHHLFYICKGVACMPQAWQLEAAT